MTGFVDRLKKERLILPPLADYTDFPYRRILGEFDPGFICTEMVSPNALIRGNSKTLNMLRMVEGGHLNGAQLVGSKPESMGKAAKIIEDMGYDYIDINMGCTIKAVINTGAGISLMRNEETAFKVAEAVMKAVGVPVTCKMRTGLNTGNRNALILSQGLVDRGVEAITIHGRTGEKKFGMKVDHEEISKVVNAIEKPVIANGGVFSGREAMKLITVTGAEGVMPGRGLIGNPWIIKEIGHALKNKTYSPPALADRKELFTRHLDYLCEFYGERLGVLASRKIIGKYFAGAVKVSRFKLKAQGMDSKEKMETLLEGLDEDDGRMYYVE